LNLPNPGERLIPTIASLAMAVANGADIVRVHDVKAAVQAIKITEAIIG
jgi:dihydropteroate synthase